MAQLDRYVLAQYSDTLFETMAMPDGSVYNIALDFEGTAAYRKLLEAQLAKYRSRLVWLTRGSLLAFGRLQHGRVRPDGALRGVLRAHRRRRRWCCSTGPR